MADRTLPASLLVSPGALALAMYRWLWLGIWATLGVTMAVAGLVIGQVHTVVAWAVIAAGIASTAVVSLMGVTPDSGVPKTHDWARPRRTAVVVAWATAAMVAWAAVLGSLLPPLLVVAAATSPRLLLAVFSRSTAARQATSTTSHAAAQPAPSRRRHRRTTARATGPAEPYSGAGHAFDHGHGASSRTVDPAVMARGLRSATETLDDTDLCHAWRASFTALERARTAEARLDVVCLRQVYLDELERRHPAGVRDWLDSGARAAGNPARYLHRAHPSSPPAPDHGP